MAKTKAPTPQPGDHDKCICGGFRVEHCPQFCGCKGFVPASSNLAIVNRRRGFTMVDNEIIDRYLATLGPYTFALYCVLCRHARDKTTFVGQQRMGMMIGCSRRTVLRSLEELEARGLICRTSGKLAGQQNIYEIIDLPNPQAQKHVETTEKPDDTGRESHTPCATTVTPGAPNTTPGCDNGDIPILKNNTSNETGTSSQLFETAKEKVPRAIPDTPWARVIAKIDSLYELANPGVDCPWNGLAFKRLRSQMESAKTWGEVEWIRCITNRFASDNINTGEPPETFVPSLKKYISGPLNEYNRDKHKARDDAKPNSAATRNSAARDAAHARIDRAARGETEVDN